MARLRPWPAHPGRPGPASRRPPGFPPPSSQPAGPPGRAVRLRGFATPCGRGLEQRAPIGPDGAGSVPGGGVPPISSSSGPGYRPPGGDSYGGSGGSATGAARVGAGLALGAPRGLGTGPEALPPPALSVWRKGGGPGPAHGSAERGTEEGSGGIPSGAASLAMRGVPRPCPWSSQPEKGSGPIWKPI